MLNILISLDAIGSFKASNSLYIWPRDALPRDCPQLKVWTYGYDSRLDDEDSIADVYEYAEDFRWQLRVLRKRTKANSNQRPIIFMAHSLGGWLFKEVRARQEQRLP